MLIGVCTEAWLYRCPIAEGMMRLRAETNFGCSHKALPEPPLCAEPGASHSLIQVSRRQVPCLHPEDEEAGQDWCHGVPGIMRLGDR